MGYKYVVFGAGRQGLAAVYDLVINCDADEVLVVEPHGSLDKVRQRLYVSLLLDGQKVKIVRSVDDDDLQDYDVILSCAPYGANLELTERAIRVDVPFCDLGGNPEMVTEQEKLVSDNAPTSPVVTDCGVSPGISNILAASLARKGCTKIRVRCGGLPTLDSIADMPDNALGYKLVFSPEGLISEYSGEVPVIRNGKIVMIRALSVIEPFDDSGNLMCSPTSNNSSQVVEYFQSLGVQDYNYMTIRYHDHWELVNGWKTLGYLRGDRIADAELATRLSNSKELAYDAEDHTDILILSAKGSKQECGNGKEYGYILGQPQDYGLNSHHGYTITVHADSKTRFTAMELMTSWGITIVAHHMASGRGQPFNHASFATPERFMEADWTVPEIVRRLKQVN